VLVKLFFLFYIDLVMITWEPNTQVGDRVLGLTHDRQVSWTRSASFKKSTIYHGPICPN